MITVACVLRSGGRYTADWVRKLQAGVAKHAQGEYRFVCLSDVAVPCERIPLQEAWPRWWSKIELYTAGLFDGPVLFLDLDTVIVGDVLPLARATPGFTMVSDFFWPSEGNSCAVSFMGDVSKIRRVFERDVRGNIIRWDRARGAKIGDQGFTFATMRPVDFFSRDEVVSFKRSGRNGAPAGARLICFHGNPKPDQPLAGWAHDEWAAL